MTAGTSEAGDLTPRLSADYVTTPDDRYLVVRGRLWRKSNPSIPEEQRKTFVTELMAARRDVAFAKRAGDAEALKSARRSVNAAKVALGERGSVWWHDKTPNLNRHLVKNSPYATWYSQLHK